MSGTDGYIVNYPALDGVRQSLEDCHLSLTTTMGRTAPGCTAAAEAYRGWSTSAATHQAHAVITANLTGHTNNIADYAVGVHTSVLTYSNADQAATGAVASVTGGV
jgi:hypothetical protein